MILVMNKKSGVGCTTLAYTLGRLFNLPIYVNKESFMLDDWHREIFPTVGKITATKRSGVLDIGSDVEKAYVRKFVNNASVIVVPVDFGYETIMKTIRTLDIIRSFNEEVPIVLVLNRLDKEDGDRDFNYREYLKNKFEDHGYLLHGGKIVLTYLRNSYGLYSNLDSGEYFLDKFLREDRKGEFERFKEYFMSTLRHEYDETWEHPDYDLFRCFVAKSLDKVDYEDEAIYEQEKDMVVFRNGFKRDFHWLQTSKLLEFGDGKYAYKENKLVRDMAYIAHSVFECMIDSHSLEVERLHRRYAMWETTYKTVQNESRY